MTVFHCQLGYMRALVDSDVHKVRIPAWEDTSHQKSRPVQSWLDARTVAAEAWKLLSYRIPDIEVRIATDHDLEVFAAHGLTTNAIRAPRGEQLSFPG